jgi:hypothetical protein
MAARRRAALLGRKIVGNSQRELRDLGLLEEIPASRAES